MPSPASPSGSEKALQELEIRESAVMAALKDSQDHQSRMLESILRELAASRPASPQEPDPEQRHVREQIQLAYKAYRRALGRAGPDVSVAAYRKKGDAGDVLTLESKSFPHDKGVTIVAYGDKGEELGRDKEHRREGDVRKATIPGLELGQAVSRVEVLDEGGRLILAGGPVPSAPKS